MKDQEIVPLRVVLRNFLNHIGNLESQSCPEKSYEAEFQDLKIFSENVKSLREYSCLEGEKEVNRKKNRYKDILPFDLSRVVLNEYAGIPGSDYINANFIKGASGSLAYIASQGPLPSTVNDFWRMVVQCEVQVIVMACNEEEAGKAKCEKYWVDDGEEKQFGVISVKLLKSSTVCSDFSVRTMRLKYTNSDSVIEERTVCQLHYVAWPDHGVPTVVQPLLDMVRLVRDTQASETLPVLVHCSAGCGRTGTICAIDYVWGLLRTGKLTNDFSLLNLIRDMRKQRIAMVQTKEQYVLVHQAVRELFKEQLCMIDSHPYENVDTNGLLMIKEEENTYDTIDYSPKGCSEEKRDNKEKDSVPPPLPSKRNITKFSSKYEKEIENRTAQQRSMNSKSNARCVVPIYVSNERKKVNNKECYNYSENLDKRVLDNKAKFDLNKPIPPKGILSVPQLESVPKCKTNVKRSKSLKVIRHCEKSSLAVCRSSPPENKRRSSLESNFEEHIIETEYNDKINPNVEAECVFEQKKKNVSQFVNKYDILKNSDHRTFVRSLTCVDIRPKVGFINTNSIVSSFEENVAKQKVTLMRSNTQINVLKKSNTHSQPKSCSATSHIVDRLSSMKIDNHNRIYSRFNKSGVNHNLLNEKAVNSTLKFGPLGVTSVMKQQCLLKKSTGKDFSIKSPDRSKTPNFHKLEGIQYLKEAGKPRSSSAHRSEINKRVSYEESFENYPTERNMKSSQKPEKFALNGDVSERLPHSSVIPKYVGRINQLKYSNPAQKIQANNVDGRSFREDYTRGMSSGHNDFFCKNTPLKDGYVTKHDLKSSPSFKDCYTVDESNHIETSTSSWLERDSPKMPSNFGKSLYSVVYNVKKPRNQTVLINSPDDCKEVQRMLDGEGLSSDQVYDHEAVSSDPSCSQECPNQTSEISYVVQKRKHIHQYNGVVHNSRISNVSKSTVIQPRIMDLPSGSQDITFYAPESRQSYNYFHSAPGVDLDQVAASITKNDENLMKATLEELQVRKTRLQMTLKERYLPKGVPSSGSSSDKKKQQQYL